MDSYTDLLIYVRLLNEGTSVWRPVKATIVRDDVYQLVDDGSYHELDEDWEFLPGSEVRCEYQTKSSGEPVLVAIEKV